VLVALGTAILIGPATISSLTQAAAVLCLFVMTRPFREWRDNHYSSSPRTACQIAILAALALSFLAAAWMRHPTAALAALLVPGVPAGFLFALVLANKEHSTAGELFSACSFGCSTFPVLVLAGRPWPISASATAFVTAAFLTSSASVQTIRRSARSAMPWAWRLAAPMIGAGLVAVGHDAHRSGLLQTPLGPGFLPLILATSWIAIRPPKRLKTHGWILAVGTLASALWCATLLR
jgi:hypothetical protein